MSYTLRVSRAQCEAILEALIKHPPQAPVTDEDSLEEIELALLVEMFKDTIQEPEDHTIVHAFVI